MLSLSAIISWRSNVVSILPKVLFLFLFRFEFIETTMNHVRGAQSRKIVPLTKHRREQNTIERPGAISAGMAAVNT